MLVMGSAPGNQDKRHQHQDDFSVHVEFFSGPSYQKKAGRESSSGNFMLSGLTPVTG